MTIWMKIKALQDRLGRLDDRGRTVIAAIVVLQIFVVSRLIFSFYYGVRFDSSILNTAWQFVDNDLLQRKMLESLLYFHSNPPLFSLLKGLILKIAPGHLHVVYNVLYLGLSACLSIILMMLFVKFKFSHVSSVLLTIFFMLSPASVLYENWAFYTFPLCVLLVLASFLLHRGMQKGTTSGFFAFFAVLATLVLMRSMFHLLWFVLATVLVLLYARDKWKKVLIAALVPFIVLFAFYAKNYILFGNFGSSTWLGMSLHKISSYHNPRSERLKIINKGASYFIMMNSFASLDEYKPYLGSFQKTGIEVLDLTTLPSGINNYNNSQYIMISNKYLRGSKMAIMDNPKYYLKGIKLAHSIFFLYTSDYGMSPNRLKLKPYDDWYYKYTWGIAGSMLIGRIGSPGVLAHLVWITFYLSLVYGFVKCAVLFKVQENRASTATLFFICFTAVYVLLVSILFEVGENNRFRFLIEPYSLFMLSIFVKDAVSLTRTYLKGNKLVK